MMHSETTPKFVRSMKIVPGWDCILIQPCVLESEHCKPGRGASHGRHAAEVFMSVLDPKAQAEVTFSAYTGWYPSGYHSPHTMADGVEVSWHTGWPQRGQTDDDKRTSTLTGACADWDACYNVSSGLTAYEPFRLLVASGSDSVFEWLENKCRELIEERQAD